MKKQPLTIGLAVTVSGRWPRELPEERLASYSAWLAKTYPTMKICAPQWVIGNSEELEEAADLFLKEKVDIIVMVYGAFTGDDVPTRLCDLVQKPLVLWAPYEPPFAREDRLYANALVSMTMNYASVRRLGYTCYGLYGGFEDERVVEELTCILYAYQAKKIMNHAMLGLFGYRVTGFYNSTFDETLIRKVFGVRMEETDLKMVFDEMQNLEEADVQADMQAVSTTFQGACCLPQGHLENHSRLYLAMKNLVARQGYDYGVLKCWPEMGGLHTTPCAVLGRLADDNIHVGCEGDVDASLTTMALHAITGCPPFITDMININEEINTMTFWHCGNAAPSLHDESSHPVIANHPLAGQGTAFWTSLKAGAVTIARFYNFHGKYRLFLMKGEAIEQDRYTRGTMANVKLQNPVRNVVLDMMKEEIPHHYSLVWADVAGEMKKLAELLQIEVIEM